MRRLMAYVARRRALTPDPSPKGRGEDGCALTPDPSPASGRGETRGRGVVLGAIVLTSLLWVMNAVAAEPADPLGPTPSWQPPTTLAVRNLAAKWLAEQKVDEAIRTKAQQEIWDAADDAPADAQTLARLAMTFALADPRAEKLVRLCAQTQLPPELPSHEWLLDAATPPVEAANLRLLYGRWLAHQSLFDEAAGLLADLEPGDVVDPASLLFYQAVVHHQLLDRDAGLEAIDRLLEGAEHCPRRYAAIAHLLRDDLKDLAEDSLDHIARRMGDIERRLGLGRAGDPVLRIEDGVIESLDKLIKKLEEQLQQQQGGAGANNTQSTKPASDSQLMGGTGPGQVTPRRLADQHGWGNLPPKDREEALQQIGRGFPSHYQDVIEQYFRRLAEEE